jgi:hypothetical protein
MGRQLPVAALFIVLQTGSHAGLVTPETRTLTPEEAQAVLERDWAFQADGAPTVWRTRLEIALAREIAARLSGLPHPPDVSRELRELDRIGARLPIPPPARAAAEVPVPAGLVVRWAFDDPEPIEGATVRGSVHVAPGVNGGALSLFGAGSIACGPLATQELGEAYTVCAWLNTTVGVADVLGTGVGPGCFLMVVNQGPVRVHHWTAAGGNVHDGTASVNDGRWHHVAQVVDRQSIRLYVDGKLDLSAPLQGDLTVSSAPLCLGSRTVDDGAWRLRGLLDEVCVFARALGDAEVAALYEQCRAQAMAGAPNATCVEQYFAVRRAKRALMLKHPAIDFEQVLFVDVPCYDALNHESMHRVWPQAQENCGRLLVLEGLHPGGALRKLAAPKPGMFWRPDLSFDARKVLFSYRPVGDRTFHLYEINLDGSGLRQVTRGGYDDLDPIYAPDGHILFLSNRGNSYARCAVGHPSYVLARCDGQGRNLYLLSASNEPEYTPALLPDGRVLYTRWEYTDKELMRIQSLWTCNPDGTDVRAFYGNQSYRPDMLLEARPIPNSPRVLFCAQGHHDIVHGCVGMLDLRSATTLNYPEGLTKVTAELPWTEVGDGPFERSEQETYHPAGRFEGYRSPYPLSEELFLVSAKPVDGRFALYLMDVWGNKELVYEGAYDVLYAQPVRPRPRPPVVPDRVDWPGSEREGRPVTPGTVYSGNVLEGLGDEVRAEARYLRVINQDYTTFTFGLKRQAPTRWGAPGAPHMHAGPPLSVTGNDGLKRVLGTVPIEADGSVYIELPPCKQLHFQLLDDQFRALQTMRSFTNVMPGESRGCLGCHESHSRAPAGYAGLALRKGPVRPTPPPWGAEYSMGYERDIQPILDRHCGECHREPGPARDALDLTLRPSADFGSFPEPYVTLTLGRQRGHAGDFPTDCEGGVAGTILPMAYPNPPEDDLTIPPMTTLSRKSRLVELAGSGEHYRVRVDDLSRLKLITWIDLLCPYLGEDEIRALPDPDPQDPLFRDSPYPPRTPGVQPFADSPYPPRMRNAPAVNRAYCQDDFPTQADRLRGPTGTAISRVPTETDHGR